MQSVMFALEVILPTTTGGGTLSTPRCKVSEFWYTNFNE